MYDYRFTHGTAFKIDDNEYVVRKELGDEIELKNLSYQSIETWSLTELIEKWDAGKLSFKVHKGTEFEIDFPDYDLIPEELKKEANERLKVLKPVLDGDILPSEFKDYVESLSPKIALSTLYNWKRRYEKTNDIRSLVSRTDLRGPKRHWSDELAIQVIDEIVEEFLYSGEKYTLQYLYAEYIARINELNACRDEENKVKPVSSSTFYRRKNEVLDIHKVEIIQHGKVIADLNMKGSKYTVKATRPLERVELDWTPVDILLVDPNTLKARRPNLVYAIDKFSNHPLGFYVTFNNIDSDAVKQCLLHCLMPKTYIKDIYTEVENEWEAFGKPENLILDNSKVNESFDIDDVCFQLGIEKTFCPIDSGYIKGTIERAFKTINTKVFHTLKGTTKSNIFERGRYDSEKKACITMQGFIYICHIALVDLVANQFNTKIRMKPIDKWKEGLKANPQIVPSLSRTKRELQLILMCGLEQRKITNKGIVLKNEYYTSSELMNLRQEMRARGIENQQVRVRFDLSDVRSIFVYNPFQKKYIEAYNKELEDKGFLPEMPVLYSDLELDSKIYYEEKNKQTDIKTIGRVYRKIRLIQDHDSKKIAKIKRGKSDVDVSNKSYIGVSTEGISHIQLDTSEAADTIQILKDESNDVLGKNKKEKGKKIKDKKNRKTHVPNDEELPYITSYQLDEEDLPEWEVHYKGGPSK